MENRFKNMYEWNEQVARRTRAAYWCIGTCLKRILVILVQNIPDTLIWLDMHAFGIRVELNCL
jgi:hypothetical protein